MENDFLIKNKNNAKQYIFNFIAMIPIVSSALCALYIILMYSEIKILVNDFHTINNILAHLNSTKIDKLVGGLIQLENCALTKLQICR